MSATSDWDQSTAVVLEAGQRPAGTATTSPLHPAARPIARVLVVGTELLSRKRDENGPAVALGLRRRGFDVVDFGNADRFDHERTVVLDRIGRPEYAREVAATFQGLPIESAPDSGLYLDVTVRIGRDLEEVLERADEEAGEVRGWRGWLKRIPGLDRLR